MSANPHAVKPHVVRRDPSTEVTLAPALVLLALVATWLAAGLPGFAPAFFYSVLVAGMTRIAVGYRGETLVPRRLFVALASVLGVASVVWLFGLRGGGRGAAIVGMLCVVAAFQALLLLGSMKGTRAYVIILLSSVHAVGTAFLRKDLEALLLILAYAVVLLWSLLLYERRHAIQRAPPRMSTVRRVRQLRKDPLPWRIGLRTLGMLVAIGFPLAVAIVAAVPPLDEVRRAYDFRGGAAEDDGGRLFDARRRAASWITGPSRDTSHVEYGSESEIKQSHVVFCEVQEPGSPVPPTGIFLRDNVQDVYNANGDWDASPALMAKDAQVLRPARDGWFNVPGPTVPGGVERELTIQLHRGAYGRWYLQPWVTSCRLLRGSTPAECVIDYAGNETLSVRFPPGRTQGFQPGDRIEQVYIRWAKDDPRLRGRRSDASVSPLPTYLQLPESTRRAVLPFANAKVGVIEDPWLRARILEDALKSERFTYTLGVVGFEGDDNMADFFGTSRRGHCGRYATALCTLLRALGHPARYVRGFWGGEPMETRPWTLFRFSHYHAWTELYLDGIGWVALNPTPPDREAADRTIDEHAIEDGAEGDETEAGEDAVEDVPAALEFDREAYREFWQGVGTFLDSTVARPARVAFGPRTGYAGLWVLLALLGVLAWRTRRRELVRRIAGADGKLPKGVYGRALYLLARHGVRRRPQQTPRELLATVALVHPDAEAPLDVLTRGFEAGRYGGRPDTVDPRAAKDALRTLEQVLSERKRVRS
ncbi:MAG: transglutaminaseTgpA domain-containing protein [Planctomycetota bacterium]|nr:transglutaminaseTgpA domain-containing protein [Planctomycetota bacterium]